MRYFVFLICFAVAGCAGGVKIVPEAVLDIFRGTPDDTTQAQVQTPIIVAPPPPRPILELPLAETPAVQTDTFGITIASLGNVAE